MSIRYMSAPGRSFWENSFFHDFHGSNYGLGNYFWGHRKFIFGTSGDDDIVADKPVKLAVLGRGDDEFTALEGADLTFAGSGDDTVRLEGDSGRVSLGRGDDVLELSGTLDRVDGGRGQDTLRIDADIGDFDFEVSRYKISLIDRFSGEELTARRIEDFSFNDISYDRETIEELFDPRNDVPTIQVGGGTQTVTVNDPDPSISVIWDRTVQQAVIDTDSPVGPTVASRAYAMVHTAIYDAWASYDDTAVRVSFDAEGDNQDLFSAAFSSEANMAKAMSFAAYNVLLELFPDQKPLFDTVMDTRLGYSLEDDGSLEAEIGIDAAQDLLARRSADGSNQQNDYQDTTGYTPFNPGPNTINDITRWTPENVPIDPEDASPEQTFLTPHWLNVESFALPETASGETDFGQVLPPAPQPFFAAGFEGSTLNFAAKTITLGADVTIDGTAYSAGDEIAVSKDLIGTVINAEFIAQAENVVEISAGLTDKQKIIAEFWEDGGGTAFPPGTFMTFAQFVSARDDNSLAEDAQLFLAMGNAVFDAGIATWQSKVEYDYARPVRAIRDLGELGLIGEEGVDELTGETGFVIEAWGGIDPATGEGLGTRTILAENFVTFQRPGADPSPPFAEYTSGHSAFSAAGAEVLSLFTGSDAFGGSLSFAPDTIQFEPGVPATETVLEWETFKDAADEAGISRLYGGIHFTEGDVNGRVLGQDVGAAAYELAQSFIDGTATDEDRPFYGDDTFLI